MTTHYTTDSSPGWLTFTQMEVRLALSQSTGISFDSVSQSLSQTTLAAFSSSDSPVAALPRLPQFCRQSEGFRAQIARKDSTTPLCGYAESLDHVVLNQHWGESWRLDQGLSIERFWQSDSVQSPPKLRTVRRCITVHDAVLTLWYSWVRRSSWYRCR